MDALAPPAVPLDAELPPILEFTGPLRAELRSFLPAIYSLHVAGLMRRRAIRTYQGMREFYFFLGGDQVLQKPERRGDHVPRLEASAGADRIGTALPDYRARYGDGLLPADKPLLIVRNEFVLSPGRAPHPALAADLLRDLFAGLIAFHRIVYWRPGMLGANTQDADVARSCSGIVLFDDLVASFAQRFGLTELKLRLYAQARAQVGVPGAGVDLASLFSGLLVAVFDPAGKTEPSSYPCPAARPGTEFLHCRTEQALRSAIPVLRDYAALAPVDAAAA